MIKFTDEQKRELLTKYKELLTKSISYVKEPNYINVNALLKNLETVENNLSRLSNVEWAYIFTHLFECSATENEKLNNAWGVSNFLRIAGLFAI